MQDTVKMKKVNLSICDQDAPYYVKSCADFIQLKPDALEKIGQYSRNLVKVASQTFEF